MKSGRTNLRMPRNLHQRLCIEAERGGVSLNTWIVRILEGSLDDRIGHLSVAAAEKALAALQEFVAVPETGVQVVSSMTAAEMRVALGGPATVGGLTPTELAYANSQQEEPVKP